MGLAEQKEKTKEAENHTKAEEEKKKEVEEQKKAEEEKEMAEEEGVEKSEDEVALRRFDQGFEKWLRNKSEEELERIVSVVMRGHDQSVY